MSAASAPRGHLPQTLVRIGLRMTLLIAVTIVAFRGTWADVIEEVSTSATLGVVVVLPVLAVFAALGTTLRRGAELPIHDRQTDMIVGVLGLGMSAAVKGLLMPRYRYLSEMLHLDLLAVWLFVLSGCILLFGLRPVSRYWPTWLLLLAVFPPPYRILRIALGGENLAAGAAMVPFAMFAAAIAVGRTRTRRWIGVAGTLLISVLTLVVLEVRYPDAPTLVFQAVPALLAVFLVTLVMYIDVRRGSSLKPLQRAVDPLTAPQAWAAALTVLIAAGAIAVIPTTRADEREFRLVPGLNLDGLHSVPAGWTLLGDHDYPWAPRYFGTGTEMSRHVLLANLGNPRWDKDSRRRRLIADVIRADNGYSIDRFPEFALYRMQQPRISPPSTIDLGYGVTGRLNTVVDDRRLLSWTWLSWNWSDGRYTERISLIAADNHLPDAEFPQLNPSPTATFENMLHILLRGQAVVLDPESDAGELDSEHKDGDLLTLVARDMVRAGRGGH